MMTSASILISGGDPCTPPSSVARGAPTPRSAPCASAHAQPRVAEGLLRCARRSAGGFDGHDFDVGIGLHGDLFRRGSSIARSDRDLDRTARLHSANDLLERACGLLTVDRGDDVVLI